MIYNEIYHRFCFCATCLFYTSRVTSPAYDSGGTELDIFDTQGTLVQIKSCKSTHYYAWKVYTKRLIHNNDNNNNTDKLKMDRGGMFLETLLRYVGRGCC